MVFHGFHEDPIAVDLDQHHYVLATAAQFLWKFASLVGVHQAFGLVAKVVGFDYCLLLLDGWSREESCFGVFAVVVVVVVVVVAFCLCLC